MRVPDHLAATFNALFFVILALVFCSVIFEIAGYSAPLLLLNIAEGAFLSWDGLATTLRWALPLAITSVGVLICFRSGYMNIGAQGQFYFGAILAAFAVEYLNGMPAWIVIPGVLVAGMVGGALWSAWPGYLKVRFGTDEVITTLMANFVAALLLVFVTSGPLKDPSGSGQTSATRPVADAYRISDSTGLSPTIGASAIVVVALGWLLMNRTAVGLIMRVTGRNPVMTMWQGAKLWNVGMISCLIGGALAGLSGGIELLGPNGRLISEFQPGHGFTAVLVALVAGGSVAACAIVAVFFGGLAAASLYLPIFAGLPSSAIAMINGAIAVFITASKLPFQMAWPIFNSSEREKR